MINEQKDIQEQLSLLECPHCKLLDCLILDGPVYYTNPLMYTWKCVKCNNSGLCKYDSVPMKYMKLKPRKLIIVDNK